MMSLRILLADDHEVLRQGARALLEAHPGWEVCGEAETGREAVTKAEELCPDIVVLDVSMPGLSGLEVTRAIKRVLPATEILIFTGHSNESVIHSIFQAGARGYLLKSGVAPDLVAAVEALAAHRPYMSAEVASKVFERYLQSGAPAGDEESSGILTSRERETVQLLAEGKTNKEVAGILGIGVKTAEAHRAAIIRKLGLKSFSELIRYAIRNHIVEA